MRSEAWGNQGSGPKSHEPHESSPACALTPIIVNASAGQAGDDRARRIARVFEGHGIKVRMVMARSGAEINAAAQRAAMDPSRIVVAAGGDGTVNAVASNLIGSGKSLGVLPLGTLNHFAKDLNIPQDLEAAARTILEGQVVNVDVGEVNGRYFLNNSSLGIYPRMVVEREQQQKRGRGKWLAFLSAAFSMLHRYPVLFVRLTTDSAELARRTAIVFVGNNEYQLEGLDMGARSCLDRGQLHVYVMHDTGIWGLVRLFFSAVFRKLDQVKEFDTMCTRELWVEGRRKYLRVALDGEVTVMEMPLHYRTRLAALRVIAPPASQVSGS
jgi:diacylglycerol kinase family enzyme